MIMCSNCKKAVPDNHPDPCPVKLRLSCPLCLGVIDSNDECLCDPEPPKSNVN
jgi:hypothetical protein